MDRIIYHWKHSATTVFHGPSQMALGMIYEYGYGVEQDDEEALKWYQMSADQKLIEGQTRVARMMRDGRGTKRPNDKKALQVFRDAARGGNAEAFYNIGKVLSHRIHFGLLFVFIFFFFLFNIFLFSSIAFFCLCVHILIALSIWSSWPSA
mmetsp:Transcript_21032/g.24861  ORF Transcript_21032/g.24861 Transcript_21032/m.24861 type:complete len:151 (-) Transcript_21032:655-1107(-)